MADSVEVAEDFKASLQFLDSNDRYAINNFTVIAKESVQYADAISNVLIDHIAKAAPNHKLPALYVLDSIVKNIGTPYTLFLGHRLYSTFMDAYSLVDAPIRRKLDEMLKTWKSPVPGSSDSRPVFQPDVTGRIENALLQVRAKAQQHDQKQQLSQQELLRGRQPPRMPTPVRQGYIDTSEPAFLPAPPNPPPQIQAQLPIHPQIPLPLPPHPPVHIAPPPNQAPEMPSTDFLASLLAKTMQPIPNYGHTPPVQMNQIARPLSTGPTDGPLHLKADLKKPRRHLIAVLYDDRPNRCFTCGRRFQATPEGKAKKAQHLDWHFSTNQRILSAGQRGQGQGRSWYVDEMEWVKSRESGESNGNNTSNENTDTATSEVAGAKGLQDRVIRAPTDHRNNAIPCPICQDKFNLSWNEDLQDFVYVDAVQVGNVVYHASCYADYKRDNRTPTPMRDKTPNSILGKRSMNETHDDEAGLFKHQRR